MRELCQCSSSAELEGMDLADGTLDSMQAAVRVLIEGVGEDPSREGLLDTPRVSDASIACINFFPYM